jgi:hypothetical protein
MAAKVYSGIRVKQSGGAKPLVLFAAPATDIESWVGVPQKRRLGEDGDETAGFQRTVSPTRQAALEHFFSNPLNVMQNPLLCAIRKPVGVDVSFKALGELGGVDYGEIHIEVPQLEAMTLEELFRGVRQYLEERAPVLATRQVAEGIYKKIETRGQAELEENADHDESTDTSDESPPESEESSLDETLFEESQIAAFWDQIKARERFLQKLGPDKAPKNELLGFTRDVLQAFLRPVVLVDGQHRLEGALASAKTALEDDEKARDRGRALIEEGLTADAVMSKQMQEVVRQLPVSLLLDESPAEHVFQFVVVNQKATPVPKALLATIISTSLDTHELATIKTRLSGADILLENSQAISSLARNPASPFGGRVARGFEDDAAGKKLSWSVLGSLSDVFRSLKGAKFYHDPALDHADVWRGQQLDSSTIVGEWQARDFKSAADYWKDANGPWRDVFNAFWSATRDKLANNSEEDAHNFWGNPRTSNIFNKPSLLILTVDFFSFLREQRVGINSAEHVKELVAEWLKYVHPKYFARDWKLDGVKKDSVGIRRQWSFLWARHRSSGGDPPKPDEFSKLRRE